MAQLYVVAPQGPTPPTEDPGKCRQQIPTHSTPRKSKSDSSSGMVAVGLMMISLLALVAAKRRAGHDRS
jgi:LPXTG-motif cell wall-anchored protein